MERDYYVYIHRNKINNKRYIGLTHQNPNERWHNGTNYYHNQYFTNAIKKYGWDNFEHEIVASGLTGDEASALEVKLIAKFRSNEADYGYNLDAGGLRTKHSEETKRKMSEAAKGRVVSEETREKIRQAAFKQERRIGWRHSEEAKRKNAEAHKHLTHTLTQESKNKIMMSCKNRKEVICIETGVVFPSIGYAAKQSNTSQGSISNVLTGKRKTVGGYHWVYKEQQQKV